VTEVHGDSPIEGTLAGVIGIVMFVFLLVLAVRYLVLLGLAAYSQTQPLPEPWSSAEGDADAPFVSIIVPAFNEAPMIRAVLESLLAIDYPRCEVIVVDDGSSDQTFLHALPYQCRRADIDFRVLAKAT